MARHPFRNIVQEDYLKKNIYFWVNLVTLPFGAIFLAPIRIFAFIWVNFTLYFIIKLADSIFRLDLKSCDLDDRPDRPPKIKTWVRNLLIPVLKFLNRAFYFTLGVVKITYINKKENYRPDKAKICIFAPHTSQMDSLVMGIHNDDITTIVASFIAKVPIFNWFVRAMDPIFVDAVDKNSTKKCVEKLVHRNESQDWKSFTTYLSPEGTTGNGCYINSFQQGAFLAGKPVQPLIFEFPEWFDYLRGNLTPERRRTRGSGWACWCYDSNIIFCMIYYLCSPWVPCIIEYLPVYEPNPDEMANPKLFAENVEKYMAKYSKMDCSKANRLDGLILERYSKEKNYNNSLSMFDFADKNLNFQAAEMEETYGKKIINKKFVLEELNHYLMEKSELTFRDFVEKRLQNKFVEAKI